MIRFLIFIFICCLIAALCSCSKSIDCSYLNTDRRPQVIRVSERYTIEWSLIKVVYDSLPRDVDAKAYLNLKPDTIISSCSIDKIDSLFRIEVRKYKIQ